MRVLELLLTELRAGLPRLHGARVSLVVPVRQAVIDEVLPLLPGLPPGTSVALGADQQVRVRYGAFQATARLRPAIDLRPAPVVTLDLSSQMVAWGLQRASLPPFVRVSGRQVQIWLAEIPALRDLAAVWPHVEAVTCASTEAGLEITAVLHATGTPATTSSAMPARRPPTGREGGRDSGRLETWVRHQFATGLPALQGARLVGTVSVPVDVLNEWVAVAVTDMASARPTESAAAPLQGLDRARLASWVRHVRVDATPGVITLDVEVGIDG